MIDRCTCYLIDYRPRKEGLKKNRGQIKIDLKDTRTIDPEFPAVKSMALQLDSDAEMSVQCYFHSWTSGRRHFWYGENPFDSKQTTAVGEGRVSPTSVRVYTTSISPYLISPIRTEMFVV